MSSTSRHFLTTAPSLSILTSTIFRRRGMLLSRRLCCRRLRQRALEGSRGRLNGYGNLDSVRLGDRLGGAFPDQPSSSQAREGISSSTRSRRHDRQRLSALVRLPALTRVGENDRRK